MIRLATAVLAVCMGAAWLFQPTTVMGASVQYHQPAAIASFSDVSFLQTKEKEKEKAKSENSEEDEDDDDDDDDDEGGKGESGDADNDDDEDNDADDSETKDAQEEKVAEGTSDTPESEDTPPDKGTSEDKEKSEDKGESEAKGKSEDKSKEATETTSEEDKSSEKSPTKEEDKGTVEIQSTSGPSDISTKDEKEKEILTEVAHVGEDVESTIKRQQELKEREISLKAALMSHSVQHDQVDDMLQNAVQAAAGQIRKVRELFVQMGGAAKVAQEAMMKELDFKVMQPKDLPRTIPGSSGGSPLIIAGENLVCPINCDPTLCHNKPEEQTQCFKPGLLKNGVRQHTCEPFLNEDDLACPDGFTKCALVSPERGNTFELWVSDKDRDFPQVVSVHGTNMNTQCLKLLIVPENHSCSPEVIQDAVRASLDIMGVGTYPILDPEDRAAIFTGIRVYQEGTFKMCLVQIYAPPGATTPKIIGSSKIGKVISTKGWKEEPPKEISKPVDEKAEEKTEQTKADEPVKPADKVLEARSAAERSEYRRALSVLTVVVVSHILFCNV